jgi:hypothetical protein
MDGARIRGENRPMTRHRHEVYTAARTPRYCVIFDLQWQVIESVKLEARTDLSAAMAAAIERLVSLGWQTEGSHEFGFVFLRRAGERRLLILTERDPYDRRPQSFSPFSQSVAPRS